VLSRSPQPVREREQTRNESALKSSEEMLKNIAAPLEKVEARLAAQRGRKPRG
jgi:hypothetical protein